MEHIYTDSTEDEWWKLGSLNSFQVLQILDSQAPCRWSLAAQKAGWDIHSPTAEDDLRHIFTAVEAEKSLTVIHEHSSHNEQRHSRPHNNLSWNGKNKNSFVGQNGHNNTASQNGGSKSHNTRKDRNDQVNQNDYREGRHHEKNSHGHRSGTKTNDYCKNKHPLHYNLQYLSDNSLSNSFSSELELSQSDSSSSGYSSSDSGTAAHYHSSNASDSSDSDYKHNNKNHRQSRRLGSG
jgi:hypothetical protein